ncbi:MAG TPA: GNAT family N-acetyltransferase [Jatrophihabitans sp.]|nr:GNAT family N-acetyltransferase [Jatrophihabitans sp.]
MTVSWRPLELATVPEWAELVNTLAKADDTGEFYDEADLAEELGWAGFDPRRDSLAAWQDGRLVGFLNVTVSGNLDRAGQASAQLDGGVHPDYRGRGIGRQLMDTMEPRAAELVRQRHPGAATAVLRAGGGVAGASVRPLLERRGYRQVRHFHHLERPLPGELPEPPALPVRRFSPELTEQVRLAHNEAFAEHWGSSPRTPENWRELVESRSSRPELSFLSLAEDGTVDAYLLSWQWQPGELHIGLVGTRPRARGRGLARACLAAALRAGAEDGLTRANLGVDSENATGAGRLYASVGFQPKRVVAAYERPVS